MVAPEVESRKANGAAGNAARTVVIGCETLRLELEEALRRTELPYPVLWVESGLHNTPKKLSVRLQDVLEHLPVGTDRVLFSFGSCGGSLIGVGGGNYRMVLPHVDDCISLLLGSVQARIAIADEHHGYFLTENWFTGERNLFAEYGIMVDKYGKDTADGIYEELFAHYRNIVLIDTGTYDIASLQARTCAYCSQFGLGQVIVPGTVDYLVRLLQGPWDTPEFVVKEPGEAFTEADVRL